MPSVEEHQFTGMKSPGEDDESLETIDKQLSSPSPLKGERDSLGLIAEQPLEKLFKPQSNDDLLVPRLQIDVLG